MTALAWLTLMACPGEPPAASTDASGAVPGDAGPVPRLKDVAAPEEAVSTERAAPDTVDAAAADIDDGRSVDTPSDTPSAAPAPTGVTVPEATAVALDAGSGEGYLSLRGFPGVSADGMHLALLVGDGATGPLVLRIARIDGSTLLEKVLLEPGESPKAADEERAALVRRRIGARATAAQRVLAKANMRSLTRAATPAEGGTVVVESGDQLAVTLPGFAATKSPRTVLDRSCSAVTQAVFTDLEHGLVVARLGHVASPTCPTADDWQVFALTPLP